MKHPDHVFAMFIFSSEQRWNILGKVITYFCDNRSDNIHVVPPASKIILICLLSIIIPLPVVTSHHIS